MRQKPKTPELSRCWCGADVMTLEGEQMSYYVICDNNHTMTGQFNSFHRAACVWNNRIKKRLEYKLHVNNGKPTEKLR